MVETPATHLSSARILVRLALWTAIGVVLAGFERLLPQVLPWAKLGIANLAALIVLYQYGWKQALVVNVVRVIAVGLLLGTWATPVFLLSFGGGVLSVPVMAITKSFGRGRIGPIGVSSAGSFTHMLVQFVLASVLIARHGGLLLFAGPSLLIALATGALLGLLAGWLLKRLPM